MEGSVADCGRNVGLAETADARPGVRETAHSPIGLRGSPILLKVLSRRRGSCLIPIGARCASCAGDDGAGSPRRARLAAKGDAPTHRLSTRAQLPSVGGFAKPAGENPPQ